MNSVCKNFFKFYSDKNCFHRKIDHIINEIIKQCDDCFNSLIYQWSKLLLKSF